MAASHGEYLTKGVYGEGLDVTLIGCGLPKRGMGWYHALQLIEGRCPAGKLVNIVEPWFLGGGKTSPPGVEFGEWAAATPSVKFHASVASVGAVTGKNLALISGRTADNPKLLREVIDAGFSHVYLEKPGAPTVGELQEMKAYAEAKGVGVMMGYNKNVTKYVTLAREFEAKTKGASTTFVHNNAYKPEELDECFERNAEGMLKNMAVHELALLVTYYGVSVETIAKVEADKAYSVCETRGKFTDFAKIGFTITTKSGTSVTVKADRCGGSCSTATVAVDGKDVFQSQTPDAELEAEVAAMEKARPGLMPYFYLQDEDYVTLKQRCCSHILSGADGSPEGIATLAVAVETMRVAEYLTPLLTKELL